MANIDTQYILDKLSELPQLAQDHPLITTGISLATIYTLSRLLRRKERRTLKEKFGGEWALVTGASSGKKI